MQLIDVKGIGPKTIEALKKHEITNCLTLLKRIPKRYDNRVIKLFDAAYSSYQYIRVTALSKAKPLTIRPRLTLIRFKVENDLLENWSVVAYNQRFLLTMIQPNQSLVLYAKVHDKRRELVAQSVMFASSFKVGIHPLYGLEGVRDQAFQKFAVQCLDTVKLKETLPNSIIARYQLPNIHAFYTILHAPTSNVDLKRAIDRVKVEGLLRYQMKVALRRQAVDSYKKLPKNISTETVDSLSYALPFSLTTAQFKALKKIVSLMQKNRRMHAMLSGDTGSGKTVVAFLAMALSARDGYQSVLMAPTTILANQHAETIAKLANLQGLRVTTLTGATDVSTRRQVLKQIAHHEVDIIIGTHAVFGTHVHYANLGLVITDEQHRFGVRQRKALSEKGEHVDTLYLSATPIPRTFAMTLFGDVDPITIDEKPFGTTPSETKVVSKDDKLSVRNAMRETLEKHEQIYVVVPRIDDSEATAKAGVMTVYSAIKKRYQNASVDVLHGRMKEHEKHDVLTRFKQGNIDILVATSVIEVGIDAPNATLMMIYHAEHFGYAQLHQLRGRVGRKGQKSRTMIIYEGDTLTYERLKVMETVHDGFLLSEYDLKVRGFGDLIGVMQSGSLTFDHVDFEKDFALLKQAKDDAISMLNNDANDDTCNRFIHDVKRELDDLADHEL